MVEHELGGIHLYARVAKEGDWAAGPLLLAPVKRGILCGVWPDHGRAETAK